MFQQTFCSESLGVFLKFLSILRSMFGALTLWNIVLRVDDQKE